MRKIKNVKEKNGIVKVYSVNDKLHTEELVCTINSQKRIILYHINQIKSKIVTVILKGFDKIPVTFKWNGHYTKQVINLFNQKFKNYNIDTIVISKTETTSISKTKNKLKVIIKFSDLHSYISNLQEIIDENAREKKIMTSEYFKAFNSEIFRVEKKDLELKAKSFLQKYDPKLFNFLSSKEKEKISNAFFKTISNDLANIPKTKLKLDIVTIKSIIVEFEKLLETNASESKWGKFLERNLYLVNSKYIETLAEINVILGGRRKVDFGLIDFQGYLDLFEIKLPKTKLLSKKTDRGNYYWHTESIKAIVQLEKYLYNTENKSNHLEKDAKREFEKILKNKNIELKIVKPKAILILGHSKQLDNEQKMTDFRILRSSLKNIEILLYDELLEQMKNLLKKNYN